MAAKQPAVKEEAGNPGRGKREVAFMDVVRIDRGIEYSPPSSALRVSVVNPSQRMGTGDEPDNPPRLAARNRS
jgi:hypothetical protein